DLADDARVRSELLAPCLLGEHRRACRVLLTLIVGERAPESGADAEEGDEVAGDGDAGESRGLAPLSQYDVAATVVGEIAGAPLERLVCGNDVAEMRHLKSPFGLAVVANVRDPHEP